nr:FimV/HubP family polar landmark protein [Oceanicoccus sp. KOV_DT_Chl]
MQQGELTAGEKYRVKNDDTLWEIAVKSRPAQGVSVQQTMVGIQALNPDAFINGNINRLKAGSVLRLPTAQEISVSDRQAVGEVASQNRAWRQGDDAVAPQLDATASKPGSSVAATEQPRLSIATGGNTDRAADGAGDIDSKGSQALQNELAVTAEALDKSAREKEELAQNLAHMEEKLATMQRLLELKDDQLASMQANAGDQPEPVAEPSPAVEEKPKPAKPPAPAPEPDSMFSDPLVLGGAAALLLLLAAGVVVMRRRQSDEGDADTIDFIEEEPLADTSLDEISAEETAPFMEEELDTTDDLVAELEQQIAADNAAEAALAAEQEDQEVAAESAPALQAETGDVVAEAEIYIAYGRYQQAIDLLRGAIGKEPNRSDLQVKLLEVCVETRDKPSFQQQFVALQALGDEAAIADVKEMLSTVDGVSDWLNDLPGSMDDFTDEDMDADLLDDGLIAEPAAADIQLDLDDDLDIDLELDGLDLDTDDVDFGSTMETDAVSDADLELHDLGLDESFDETDAGDFAAELDLGELEAEAEEDSFTADKTVQMDAAAIQAELAAQTESTENNLDLDLDGDLDLDSLDDTDLGDLEAEFGEIGDVKADLDIAESELEPLAEELESDTETTTAELEADIDFDDMDFDLEASADNDVPVLAEFDAEPETAEPPPVETDKGFDESVTTPAGSEDDFDFLADTDEVATKLDLARAYIDMGDTEGARDILDEVLQEGNDEQKQEATALVDRIE